MSDKFNRNFVFVSDLHLSEGFLPDKKYYHKNEDFFYDDAFGRFLAYLQGKREHGGRDAYKHPWRLVIVGDFLDNLQVTTLPGERDGDGDKVRPRGEDEYDDIRAGLAAFLKNAFPIIYPGEATPPDFSEIKFDRNEKRCGLAFDALKSVWKLARIVDGHQAFFRALAEFLAAGNEVVIVKGNHDPEFAYPEFRRYFVHAVKRRAPEGHAAAVAGRIFFSPWFYYEPGLFYTEHGGQYDEANRYTFFLEPTMTDERTGATTIRLPLFGSYFVRYVFNTIEDRIPFADNVRPLRKAAAWIFKNELGFAICTLPQGVRFICSYAVRKLRSGFDILAAQEANKSQGGPWRRLLWLVTQPLALFVSKGERREYYASRSRNLDAMDGLAGTTGVPGEPAAPGISAKTLNRIYYRGFKTDSTTKTRAARATRMLKRREAETASPRGDREAEDVELVERAVGMIRAGKESKPFFGYTLPKWSGVIVRVLCALVIFDWLGWLFFSDGLFGGNVAGTVALTVLASLSLVCFWLFPRVQKELVRRHLDVEPERYLNRAADGVARLLRPKRARFIIFGHTHVAYGRPIDDEKGEAERRPKQWELNTGSWTPVFDERMVLRRNGDEFPFIQIVTEGAGGQPEAELYQWNDGVALPQRIRIIGED